MMPWGRGFPGNGLPGGIRQWIERFLLVAGMVCVAVWGWSYVRRAIIQHRDNQALEHRSVSRPEAPPAPPVAPPPRIANGDVLGRLLIPRLHLRAVVHEGAGEDTLDVALGHIPGTALPGQPGNVGVAGHRDTLFRDLRRIAKNDVIQFQTPAATYSYQVESTRIVKPREVSVLDASPHPEITLVTCYPFHYIGAAPDRFIVKARLVTPNQPEQEAKGLSHPSPARPAHLPGDRRRSSAIRKVDFRVAKRHSRELVPGLLLRVSSTDAARHRASGWLWMPRERRKIWLRNYAAHRPIVLRGATGGLREVMITRVTSSAVYGYVLLNRSARANPRRTRS